MGGGGKGCQWVPVKQAAEILLFTLKMEIDSAPEVGRPQGL